jgi:hypothetical protein
MSLSLGGANLRPVRTTYAVTWQEKDRSPFSGRLELRPRGLRFEAVGDGEARPQIVRDVGYDDVAEVRVGRGAADRIGGRPTLVVERRAGGPVRIASIAQAGIVSELAERLAALVLGGRGSSRVVVVVPLREGTRDRVRELLATGPPFDPAGVGLERHEVFLTDSEAVFLFEAPARWVLERLVVDPSLWAAATAWKDVVAGPARLAGDASSWTRSNAA